MYLLQNVSIFFTEIIEEVSIKGPFLGLFISARSSLSHDTFMGNIATEEFHI